MNLINQEKKIFSQNIIHSHPFVSICNTAANTLWWPNRIILHSLKDFLFLWNYKLWQSRVLSCWVESRHASHVWRCLPDVVQCTLQIFTDKRLKDLNCSSIQRRRVLYNIQTLNIVEYRLCVWRVQDKDATQLCSVKSANSKKIFFNKLKMVQNIIQNSKCDEIVSACGSAEKPCRVSSALP